MSSLFSGIVQPRVRVGVQLHLHALVSATCHRAIAALRCGAYCIGIAATSIAAHHAAAACPFIVPDPGSAITASAPRDGVSLTKFARRDGASALLDFEKSTHAHIAANLSQLDVNADGKFDITDSIIITRALLGFRDGALTDAITVTGERSSSAAIQTFIDNGCVADAASQATWQATSFAESSAAITNPERGFWVYLSDNFVTVTDADIAGAQAGYANVALGYAVIRLDNYRNQTLPQPLLDSIGGAFAKVRARGMKVILRFAYNYPGSETAPIVDDAPLSRVLEHIAQVAPLVQANADVIYVWQAGFIGMWGEGHSSTNGLDSPANKVVIRDALLNVLPGNRFLMWRYPPDQMAWDADAGSEADAFGTARQARIGMYNDCFMSSDTDVGTYDDDPVVRATQRAYVATRSAIVPFGGETCNAPPTNQQRRSCAAIRSEGAQFHLSYLNRTYYEGFLNQWQSEGCLDEIASKLGYRWVLKRASSPKLATRGASIQLSVALKNVGWARLYNARRLNVVLVPRANTSGATISASAVWDPRALKPGDEQSVLFTVVVPANATVDTYDVLIAAPDASPTIANVASYAIRFANVDNAAQGQSWNAARGAFATGLAITLQ
jgi:Domain of unknown function (DUF4832)/Domain of unknown function (DUF4874)